MRAIFAVGTGIALLMGANSADADQTASVDWTGPYLGLHGGARLSQIDMGQSMTSLHSGSPAIWGGQFGYDWQYEKWVLGLESDLDAGNQSKINSSQSALTSTCTAGPHPACPPLITFQDDSGIDAGLTVSVRARAGFAAGRWLLYGTGGLALTDAHARTKLTVTKDDLAGNVAVIRSSSARRGEDLVGWTLGLGGEVSLDHKVSIGVEYRHSDFGSKTVTFDSTDLNPLQAALTDDRATLRLNYRF
jgi:outer membrane immunogenic protein